MNFSPNLKQNKTKKCKGNKVPEGKKGRCILPKKTRTNSNSTGIRYYGKLPKNVSRDSLKPILIRGLTKYMEKKKNREIRPDWVDIAIRSTLETWIANDPTLQKTIIRYPTGPDDIDFNGDDDYLFKEEIVDAVKGKLSYLG
jgi:hypothetical protein